MILIDSNIPMYLVGVAHPHKADARRLLEQCISERQRLVSDAEVLQEIPHRYVAIDRRDAIQPAFDALLGVVDEIFAVDAAVVERAKAIVLGRRPRVSSGSVRRGAAPIRFASRRGGRVMESFSYDQCSNPGTRRSRPATTRVSN